MDPVSHIVVSIAAGRAGLNRTTRLATPMLIVSGLAADLDWLTVFFGPRAFLTGHRTVTHSLLGTAAIAVLTALCFTLAGRKHAGAPIRFSRAIGICAIGASLHVLLDLTNSYGVKLFWPFTDRWFALDIMPAFDLLLLAILLSGILLPMLFRLVTDEIGARQKAKTGARGAIMAFALVLIYLCGRYVLHARALDLLTSRLYRGAVPVSVGAFPDSPTPFRWAGVVLTDAALLRVDVPIAFAAFDPTTAKPFFKPEPSPALDVARATATAQLFLSFARFPRARVERNDRGYHIEITDARFEIGPESGQSMMAVIDVNAQAQVVSEELKFGNLFQR